MIKVVLASLVAVQLAASVSSLPSVAPDPVVVPEAEKARKNPVPPVPEAIESGRSLFASQCAMCHGPKGDGRGDVAVGMKLEVPNLTQTQVQKKRTDGEWFFILGHGHGAMPPEKRLLDQQKWEIVLYLRTLAKPAPSRG